ncbi:hypothetical protein FACS189434_14690 [Bacteroidia bacterium]|nr:hypothetical protein FACS189434_14690 [Bacteroidia bacterium]
MPDKAFLAFLHGGYGTIPAKTSGLTITSESYQKDLSSGGVWNLQAYFRSKMFIVGLLYAGYTSSGSTESYVAPGLSGGLRTSDKLLTTYIAPQLGMNIPVAEKFDIGWNAGFGGLWLKNAGEINGNPRTLQGSTFAVDLAARGVYNITKNLGVSAEIMYILGNLTRTNLNYHEKDYKINNLDQVSASQLTFSLGLKCSF